MVFFLCASASVSTFSEGNIVAGEAVVKKYSCAACHGANLQTPIDPAYPKLAGQPEDYIRHALIACQRGAAGPNGHTNAIMGSIAKALTHQDAQDIVAYLYSLPTSLVLRK
ncbi:MAG: c-type cytochrome [Glaciimonas sp.]|nr:c-type cytochrome [Glaciimonas sp.]